MCPCDSQTSPNDVCATRGRSPRLEGDQAWLPAFRQGGTMARMITSLLLVAGIAVLTVGMASIRGTLASNKPWHKWVFRGAGALAVVLMIALATKNEIDKRDSQAKSEKDKRAMFDLLTPKPRPEETRTPSEALKKIVRPETSNRTLPQKPQRPILSQPDASSAPKTNTVATEPPTISAKEESTPKSTTSDTIALPTAPTTTSGPSQWTAKLAVAMGFSVSGNVLSVNRTGVESNRADASHAVELTIHTSSAVSPVRMIVECDHELVDGEHLNTGTFRTYYAGLMKENPRAYVIRYDFPAFTPTTPIRIKLWSREPVVCAAHNF